MFEIRIVNLDAGSYLRMNPEKDLAKAEKEKKDLYLQACHTGSQHWAPPNYPLTTPRQPPSSSNFDDQCNHPSHHIRRHQREVKGNQQIPPLDQECQ